MNEIIKERKKGIITMAKTPEIQSENSRGFKVPGQDPEQTVDVVRMYLKDMGAVPLLNVEGEGRKVGIWWVRKKCLNDGYFFSF